MFSTDRPGKPFSWNLPLETAKSLAATGTSKQRILPIEYLGNLSKHDDGLQMITQSYCEIAQMRGDFASRELADACFHFQVIDFGDSNPLREAMMRSTGNVENVERNQCVLLHLAVSMLWNESGMSKRVPGRGRVFALAQELRRTEFANDSLASEALREDASL